MIVQTAGRTFAIALLRLGLGALFFAPNSRFMAGYRPGLKCTEFEDNVDEAVASDFGLR